MSNTVRRNLLLLAGSVAVWYLCVLFFWALRPLEDAVPVGVDETGKPASQVVECNNLFASTARPPGNLPVLTNLNYEYNRIPCVAQQRDARVIFVLDTVVTVVVLSGVLVIMLRVSRREEAVLAVA